MLTLFYTAVRIFIFCSNQCKVFEALLPTAIVVYICVSQESSSPTTEPRCLNSLRHKTCPILYFYICLVLKFSQGVYIWFSPNRENEESCPVLWFWSFITHTFRMNKDQAAFHWRQWRTSWITRLAPALVFPAGKTKVCAQSAIGRCDNQSTNQMEAFIRHSVLKMPCKNVWKANVFAFPIIPCN